MRRTIEYKDRPRAYGWGKPALAAILLSALACRPGTRARREPGGDRPAAPPAAPLEGLTTASDARVDSIGRLAGSFVGEGTSRAIHLLSTDTALIASLLRRYRPDLGDLPDRWAALARAGAVPLTGDRAPAVELARVGSPAGHTAVRVTGLTLHGGRCGAGGSQLEMVVQEADRRSDLTGPVLGSLRLGSASGDPTDDAPVLRKPPEPPSSGLTDTLVLRTRAAIDSALAVRSPELGLAPLARSGRDEINTLADVDAADVVPYRAGRDRVRYAVALRERRRAAKGDTVMVAGVMAWDPAGGWRQAIFRPTVLSLVRGRPAPLAGERPLFWRRLQALSGFGSRRDVLWLEQVDARQGSVIWGIIEPRGNIAVAATEVGGPCR